MALGLDNAITQLGALMSVLPDIKQVYVEAPEELGDGVFPCVTIYPYSGEISPMASTRAGRHGERHIIYADIRQTRIIVPVAFTAVKVWPRRVLDMLLNNPSLNGSVNTIDWPVAYEATDMPYGRETHYGMRFVIAVRIF